MTTPPEVKRIGPDTPDNTMVICPQCTSQFPAISVHDQKERTALQRLLAAEVELRKRAEADFSRTDAARVEAEAALRIERENNARHKADWTRLYQNDGLRLSELKLERDHLAARVAELESRPEVIAQLEDEKRVLAERVAEWERYLTSCREQWNAIAVENQRLAARVAALESDLSAVTASSVEHAKTIDGLRAELARARHDYLFFMTCLLTQSGGQFELTKRAMIDAPTQGSFTYFDDPVSGSRIYRINDEVRR